MICTCGREFDPNELPPSRRIKGETRRCGVCFRKRSRAAIKLIQTNDPSWILHSNARARAKRKGIEFKIDRSDCAVPSHCPVLGIRLFPSNVIHTDNSPTLDRVDNSKGYTKDNVWVISMKANKIKSNATLDELRALVVALEKKTT